VVQFFVAKNIVPKRKFRNINKASSSGANARREISEKDDSNCICYSSGEGKILWYGTRHQQL
jgi:hypothetical protein